MAEFFSPQPFTYDRRYPPLFFVAPQNEEEEEWRQRSLQRVSREYFRLGTRPDTTHQTSLSNGMELGELAMFICCRRNDKRRRPDKAA